MHDTKVLQKILKHIDDKLIGFENQIEKLTNLLDSFAETNEGGSVFLYGPPSSGKSSVVRKVVMKYAADIEIVFIDGLLHANDVSAVRIIDELELKLKRPYVVVILNLEEFVIRSAQILLYKVLDATRNQPLFAICVTSRQDCLGLLEKRVRSRLSNISISFVDRQMTFDSFKNAFGEFLQLNKTSAQTHNQSVQEFLKEGSVNALLKEIYQERRSYAILKQITSTFICYLIADDIHNLSNTNECYEVLSKAKQSVLPCDDVKEAIISGLTLRQLCLLTCCVRLVRNNRSKQYTYRRILQSYRRLTNSYLASLAVSDDIILFKELDALTDYGLLEKSVNFDGQLAFRKTSLQVDDNLVIKCLKEFSPLPIAIAQWLDELDKE